MAVALRAPCASVATQHTTSSGRLLGSYEDGVDRIVVTEHGRCAGGTALVKEVTNATTSGREGPAQPLPQRRLPLANDKIRVVVEHPAQRRTGGQIIDADLVARSGRPRQLRGVGVGDQHVQNAAHYTDLTVINDGSDGQAAILRATGVDDLLDFVNPSSVVADFDFPFPASANDTTCRSSTL